MIRYLAILIIILTVFSSCEECSDCEPPIDYPYFNLSVLNRTSLDTLTTNKNEINEDIQSIDSLLDDPDNASIADSLNNAKDSLNSALENLNSQINQVSNRLISIRSINGRENLFENINGSDTLNIFQIPINLENTSSFYEIEIEGKAQPNVLEIAYQLSDTILLETITKKAFDLRVIQSDYDSTSNFYGCEPINECSSNQLELYVEI